MKITVISPSPQSLQEISSILGHANQSHLVTLHEGGITKLRALAEQEHPDVIIVEGMCHDACELAPIETITANYPQLTIIMLCSQHTSEYLINAMRVGVREVLPSPVNKVALEAAIARAESKLGLRGTRRTARVIAFISCKGGSGATFLATNLGYQLSEEDKKVLLIDLNLQYGEAVLTVHDRKATSDIADVARNLSRLDASFLSASTVKVTPSFEILAAPEDAAQSLQIKPEHLDAILNLAINHYDFIIMDVSNNLDDLTIKALDRSHNIYLVVQMLLPYVRNTNRMMTIFRSLGYPQDKVELLVNRYMKNAEINLHDLATSSGINRMRTIPNGYKEVSKAINQGVPLESVSKSSLVYLALKELAESLLPKVDHVQGGLFRRLLKN